MPWQTAGRRPDKHGLKFLILHLAVTLSQVAVAHARKKRKKKKKGNKNEEGCNNHFRSYPGHADLADICVSTTQRMENNSNKFEQLFDRVLKSSNAPTSPKKTRKMGEIKECDEMIRSLKRDLKQAQEDDDEVEVKGFEKRILQYKKMRMDMESSLFKNTAC